VRLIKRTTRHVKFDPADDRVEHRREDQTNGGHTQHLGEYHRPERLPHLGAGVRRDDERDDTEDYSFPSGNMRDPMWGRPPPTIVEWPGENTVPVDLRWISTSR
jgi:hypothetical protein